MRTVQWEHSSFSPQTSYVGGTLSPAGGHYVGGRLVGRVGGPSSHKLIGRPLAHPEATPSYKVTNLSLPADI